MALLCLLLRSTVSRSLGPSIGGNRLWAALPNHAMLRIHGDRNSLLAALTAHWAEQQLQIPQPLRPVVAPVNRWSRPMR